MALQLVILFFVSLASVAHSQRLAETFQAEIFYDKDDLNSGLYEGTVRGRRLFTSSAIPHGQGTIYYFNNDKYHRVNYTGDWVDGTREGNGTTNFKDGSVYRGEYFDGVEEGVGTITYPDGNVLEGEFSDGNIHGNAVFKYPNGDQREGFFFDSVLDGQVIYTKNDGMIIIELWKNGEPLPEKDTVVRQSDNRNLDKTLPVLPMVPTPLSDVTTEETTTSAATISTTESQAKFDLSAIRNTIRSSDRTQVFHSESALQREPKTQNQNMDAQRLRKITDQRNRDFLLSVFNRVNG